MDSIQQHQGQEDDNQQEWPEVPTMCSICHSEPPINAVQLKNCGHIFCHSCIKSSSETTGRCALCRTEIGIEFNFQEHDILGVTRLPTSSDDGYYWFYEGFRGWWLYDADTNREIEGAYSRLETQVEKFIAGFMYIIDISNMIQQRKDGQGRARKICRAKLNELENILGVSGLKGKDVDEMLELMKSAPSIRGTL